jgi:hypothetical protein
MADLVLSDSLVNEYLKFKDNSGFDKSKIRKLLKHILVFPLKNSHSLMQDPAMAMQLEGSDPLIEIIDVLDDAGLVQSSRLKLMLIDSAILPTPSFTTINITSILPEKLQPKYGATYPNAADKNKAQAHIKALLSDATWIKITDAYLANADWNNNKVLITTLVPHKALDLTIVTNDFTQQNELNTIYNHWNIIAPQFPSNIHDRYIETDKIKILLSSGLYHLSTSSSKDFTYIIELKP